MVLSSINQSSEMYLCAMMLTYSEQGNSGSVVVCCCAAMVMMFKFDGKGKFECCGGEVKY